MLINYLRELMEFEAGAEGGELERHGIGSEADHYVRDIASPVSLYCWRLDEGNRLTVLRETLDDLRGVCFSTDVAGVERTATHQHSYIEAMFVLSGILHQVISGRDYLFRAGDVVFISPGSPHFECFEGSCFVAFLNVREALLRNVAERYHESHYVGVVTKLILDDSSYSHVRFSPKVDRGHECQGGGPLESTESVLESIVREISNHEAGAELVVSGLILRLTERLGRNYKTSVAPQDRELFDAARFEDIARYIRSNPADASVESLQRRYHYNADYFNRLVKKQTGETLSQFRQDLRLTEAARLLSQTDLRVDAVASYVGYHNQGFFYRIFSARYGMTPAKYRIAMRNQSD
jgi:AraC-like DNA-binding protein/mannose-6-phosphate isomerase-like protein (cupin superfamily)